LSGASESERPAGGLGSKYDFAAVEAKWRQVWDEQGVYRYDPQRPASETFKVDTPPPTVSGSLHIGHAFSYTHQDLLVRFHRMRGMNVFYPMGWDDNGLPTERRVENYFNVRCDPALPYRSDVTFQPHQSGPPVHLSRANFIEACQRTTAEDELVYKAMWQRLGLSIDWSKEYATISREARRVSQTSFLRLIQQGEIYAAEVPLAWDTTFRTAIAQAEMEDREVRGAFHKLRFRVLDGPEVLIATTRPELLGACVALVVHPEDPRYQSLIGGTAVTPVFHAPVPIFADRRAVMEKGTGVVMVCTFGDATDVEWWREQRLPVRQLVSEQGRIREVQFGTAEWPSREPEVANRALGSLAGLTLDQARARMVELLREVGDLIGEPEPLVHAVKFYEKGSKPLEIITTRQWFIRLLDKRDALLERGRQIQWHPPFMHERYRMWVEGLNQDWCISRQRYFGVPVPVWYPLDADGQRIFDQPILPTESQLPIDPLSDAPPGYTADQRNQPGGFAGESDVLDTWATSSLTPQLATGWPDDPDRHQALYPMDIRPQSHEIIRTWAFYTIAMSHMHEASIPWKHVVISGWILDPDRKKMSKSKGNVITPVDLLEKYSADGVRYWAARARVGVDTAYDESIFQIGRKLVTKLFNASRFVSGIVGAGSALRTVDRITHELDRGLVARLRELIETVTASYARFDWATGLSEIESFFWSEFCDDYLELVKSRAYRAGDDPEKQSVLACLRVSLSILLRLLAPTLPFVTEEIWQHEFAHVDAQAKSIHRARWPSLGELAAVLPPGDPQVFSTTCAVLREVRREKGTQGKSMRWPAETVRVSVPGERHPGLRAAEGDLVYAGAIRKLELVSGDNFAVQVTLSEQAE
jgi:valyl-tRNA synthetase